VSALLAKWTERGGRPYGYTSSERLKRSTHVDIQARADFCTQLVVLVSRDLAVAKREPLAYLLRMGVNLMVGSLLGIIYLKTRNHTQDHVISRTNFLLLSLGLPMLFNLVAVYEYHQQWNSLKKEVKDGMYHPMAAAVASWVVQAPMQFVLAACSMLPIFILGNMHWPNFPMAWFIYAITSWAFEGLAQMLSVSPSVLFGLFNYLNLYFAAFLFAGLFVDPEDVIWPLRSLCYFLPLGWSFQSFMFAIFHGQPDYDGTMDCIPGERIPGGAICGQQGFYCSSPNDPTGAACFGRTGDQLLNSLSVRFTILGDEGHYARNISLILSFGVLCRLVYVAQIILFTKVVGSEEPRLPTTVALSTASTVAPARDAPPSATLGAPDLDVAEAQESAGEAVLRGSAGVGAASSCVFAFSNLGYSITPKNPLGVVKGPPKSVLANTSATVTEGEVLAIVGPSGAGKTILLDSLNFFKGPGSPTGTISLNGRTLTRAMHTRAFIYVPREDTLWPSLTPREHLSFAYKLYQPALSAGVRETAIDGLLFSTGMTSAQHTKVGGLFFQGLSGGQRRRLSLCVALVKQPRVLILDEPTSGLDSAAAAAIITLLKSIATKCSAAVVCTIHQPSAAVFSAFNQVLVLSEGRVAYYGERDGMGPHFASIGKPLQTQGGDGCAAASPSEAVLDLVSKDISSSETVATVLDAWDASGKDVPQAPPTGMAAIALEPLAISAYDQTMVVLRRQFYLAFHDPLQYMARILICPLVCAFFGVVYVASRDQVQRQVFFRLLLLMWVTCIPPGLGISSLIGMTIEMRSVIYEIRNGMYRPFSYALATTMVQVPMLLVLGFAINVLAFAVGGWPWHNFVTFVLQYTCSLLVFESFTQLIVVAFPNPIIGILAFLLYWSSSFVFCGILVRGSDVIWPFRIFFYILPLRWLFNGLSYDLYMPSTYDGAFACVPGENVTTDQGIATCATTGFYCADALQSLSCFGRTGSQVLDTLHLAYEGLDSADDRIMNVLIMIGLVLVFKVAFVFVLWRTVELSDSPKETRSSAIVPLVSSQAEDGSVEIGAGTSSLEGDATGSVPGLRELHDDPRATALEWVEGLVDAEDDAI